MPTFRGSFALTAIVASALFGCDRKNDYVPPPSPPPSPGEIIGITSANRLVTFSAAVADVRTTVTLTGLQAGETILGIDVRPGGTTPGEVYALGSSGRIYTLNASTGAATMKSQLIADAADATSPFAALSGANFGVDFNPVVDRLRVVSDTGQNLRINVDTGATTTDGPLNIGGTPRLGVSAAAYTNNFAAACRTTLYYLDSTTDRLFTTTDPNNGTLTDVGPLGLDASATNQFEITTAADGTQSAVVVGTSGGGLSYQSINLTTGALSPRGTISGLNAGESLRGIAFAPLATTPAQTSGDLLALTASNRLLSFTNGAPQKICTSVAITGLQPSENLLGIDVRPADGALYSVGSSGRLYTVDPVSGAATQRATLSVALTGTDFGVDFNPAADRLRVVSNTGQNLRVVADTGATTADTDLNPAGSNVTAAAYTNSFAGTGTTALYVIDVANDRLMLQGQPSGNPNNGDLQTVGALMAGGDVQAVNGFDIDGRNNTAYAALAIGTATTSELHTLNLATGAASRVNAIGGGERIRGLAIAARLQALVFGVTTDNRLISFNVAAPDTVVTNSLIGGIQGGENVVGIDFRPANNRLYALTDAGRLYTIDPVTATASAPRGLQADMADLTNPYAALSGTLFGVDFNPAADRLRTVSNTEQNLRTNVDTAATTTDTVLNRNVEAVAAAYTRSFANSASTSLYLLDASDGSLLLQNPPNDGVLTLVGPLNPAQTFIAAGGFDIAGGDDGLALAALTPTGATRSSLYRVNLRTGAVTSVGPIGTPVIAPLRGLAIRLQ